jgi:hypothetical protein
LALQVLRANKLFKVTGAGNTNTGHVIRHLKKKHPVSFRRTNHVAREGFKALVSVIDADKFRWMLIK